MLSGPGVHRASRTCCFQALARPDGPGPHGDGGGPGDAAEPGSPGLHVQTGCAVIKQLLAKKLVLIVSLSSNFTLDGFS